ncbi:MAG: GNAT family N-acetyltransferase [Anaerolineales bacterium]|nr:GNAT family N-acetyltransferase [Anaerolineales bacterium]
MTTITLRAFTGPTDFPIITDLINAGFAAAEFPAIESVEETQNAYAHLENCDPVRDVRLAEDGAGTPLGYARLYWIDDQEGLRRYQLSLNVGLQAERAGAAAALLEWAGDHVRALMTKNPTERPTVLQTWVINEAKPAERMALLSTNGFEPVRYGYFMVRDLREPIEIPELPDGLYVRPVTPADDRPVFDALHEAFRDHWGYAPPPDFDSDFDEWRSWPLRNPDLYQVAFARNGDGQEQVAGMVLNFIAEEDNRVYGLNRGWADPICVRRPWRKRGVARGLIMRSLRLLADRGLTEAALGVDTQNPNGALHLYESCGFRATSRSVTMRKTL